MICHTCERMLSIAGRSYYVRLVERDPERKGNARYRDLLYQDFCSLECAAKAVERVAKEKKNA